MSRERGFNFEREFVALAKSYGYRSRRVDGHRPYDAVVGSKRVQCKEKSFDDHGRVRVARGQHKYKRGDWDVLALRWKGDIYLIPEQFLRSTGSTLLTVIKPLAFRKWIDAWSVFDGAPIVDEQQLIFDVEVTEAKDGR